MPSNSYSVLTGDKYRPLAMLDSKRKASRLLHEYADEQAVQKLKRAQQQKIQSEHTPPNQRKNKSTLNVKLRLDATFFTDKRNRHNTISEANHVRTLAVLIALFYFHHAVAHTNMCLNILWRDVYKRQLSFYTSKLIKLFPK